MITSADITTEITEITETTEITEITEKIEITITRMDPESPEETMKLILPKRKRMDSRLFPINTLPNLNHTTIVGVIGVKVNLSVIKYNTSPKID